MSIPASRWQITQELSAVGTSEVKPTPPVPWKFGKPLSIDGHQIIDTERTMSLNSGARLIIDGMKGIAGPGKLTIKLYSGVGDTADKQIAAYGPYDAAAIGGLESLAFPPGTYAGNVFAIGFVADQAAGTAFTAGSISVWPEFD